MIVRLTIRRGYTLLEVLLASAISIMLLGALYVAFDLTLRQTDAGREAVAKGDLSRAIVNRMTIDFTGCIGPMQAKSGGGVPATATAAATGTTAAATTTTATDAVTVSDTSGLSLPEGTAAADVPFQGGLVGNDKQITLFVSRVPTALVNPELAMAVAASAKTLPPDLRRVTYYLSSSGGLCRQEKPYVTADGVRNSTDPDRSQEADDLISDEVLDMTIEYFDGSAWQTEWTGSDLTDDQQSVKGPPRAIRMTLVIQVLGAAQSKTIQHVFPVRAAVGLYTPPAAEEDPAAAATTGGTE